MNDDREPTPEEIQRVREYDCNHLGHDLTMSQTWGNPVPFRVACTRCGRTWRYTEDQQETM